MICASNTYRLEIKVMNYPCLHIHSVSKEQRWMLFFQRNCNISFLKIKIYFAYIGTISTIYFLLDESIYQVFIVAVYRICIYHIILRYEIAHIFSTFRALICTIHALYVKSWIPWYYQYSNLLLLLLSFFLISLFENECKVLIVDPITCVKKSGWWC